MQSIILILEIRRRREAIFKELRLSINEPRNIVRKRKSYRSLDEKLHLLVFQVIKRKFIKISIHQT